MAVINPIRVGYQGETRIYVGVNEENQRVETIAQSIFRKTVAALRWIWDVIVLAATGAGDKIGFVAFRILNCLHPSIGPQIEIFYLRVWGMIDALRYGWKEHEIKEELALLRREKHDLQVLLEEQRPWVQNAESIEKNGNRLKGENQLLSDAGQFLGEENRTLKERVASLEREVEIVEQREGGVRKELEALQATLLRERENSGGELLQLRQLQERGAKDLLELRGQLALLEQSAPYLSEQAATTEAMVGLLARLPSSKWGSAQINQSELDDLLKEALPLLLAQLESATKPLDLALEKSSEGSPQRMALMNVKRILGEISIQLNKIPSAMERHSKWANPLAIVCKQLQVET